MASTLSELMYAFFGGSSGTPGVPPVSGTQPISGTVTANTGASVSVIGTLVSKILTAATTNATSVKASAARVYGYDFVNTTAAIKYIRLYNKASAPTVGTDVPFLVIAVPANGGNDAQFTVPISMATGLAYAVTGASPDLDATATAVGDVVGSLLYI